MKCQAVSKGPSMKNAKDNFLVTLDLYFVQKCPLGVRESLPEDGRQ